MEDGIVPALNVRYEPDYLAELAGEVYAALEAELFDDAPRNKRVSVTYGDEGLSYRVELGGYAGRPKVIIQREAIPWEHSPLLTMLRDLVSARTKVKPTYVVVQRYPHGKVGIKPHRDKELSPGTSIACLSLGAERWLVLSPSRPSYFTRDRLVEHPRGGPPLCVTTDDSVYFLPSGSLYVLNPPTNSAWKHSIPKDDTSTPRLSLTFRDLH
jgi:alkylated DNA repair dioxygenase AlkB